MRRLYFLWFTVVLAWVVPENLSGTEYKLENGNIINGEVASADEDGVVFKLDVGKPFTKPCKLITGFLQYLPGTINPDTGLHRIFHFIAENSYPLSASFLTNKVPGNSCLFIRLLLFKGDKIEFGMVAGKLRCRPPGPRSKHQKFR